MTEYIIVFHIPVVKAKRFISGLRARHFQSSASMFIFILFKKIN